MKYVYEVFLIPISCPDEACSMGKYPTLEQAKAVIKKAKAVIKKERLNYPNNLLFEIEQIPDYSILV